MAVPRVAVASDVPGLSAMLSRAFESDSIAAYLFPEPELRQIALPRFFSLQMRHSYLARGEILTYDDHASALLALGPGMTPPGGRELLVTAEMLWLLRGRVGRARQMTRLLAASQPKGPHRYIGTIGTDPNRQRQGLAGGLIASLVERCDRDGLICALEASKPENVAFYRHFGFEVHEELRISEAGPLVWSMWRRPRDVV